MKVLLKKESGFLGIRIDGSLDQKGVIDFKEITGEYYDFEEKKVIYLSDAALYLENIEFISSSGIGLIVLLTNMLSAYNKKLYLVRAPQYFRKMTAVLMLDPYLNFCDDPSEKFGK